MLVKMNMNLKIKFVYHQLCPLTSGGTVQWNHSIPANNTHPSAIYIYVAPNQLGTVKANCQPQDEGRPEPPTCRHNNTAVPGR